jgi:hypothetical protein
VLTVQLLELPSRLYYDRELVPAADPVLVNSMLNFEVPKESNRKLEEAQALLSSFLVPQSTSSLPSACGEKNG